MILLLLQIPNLAEYLAGRRCSGPARGTDGYQEVCDSEARSDSQVDGDPGMRVLGLWVLPRPMLESLLPLAEKSSVSGKLAKMTGSGVGSCWLLLAPVIKLKEHLTHQSLQLPPCGQVTICGGHGICGSQVQVPTSEDGWIPKHPLLDINQMPTVSQSPLQAPEGNGFWREDPNGQWLSGFEGRFVTQ